MGNKNTFYRILKLDKSIYSELIVNSSSIQKAVGIWIASYLVSYVAIFTLFEDFINLLRSNLSLLASGLPEGSLLELKILISDLEVAFNSEATFEGLLNTLVSSLFSGLIGVGFIFIVCKYLFRKEPNFIQIIIITGFASVTGLLNIPILFIDSFGLKLMIVFISSIYSLICLGSGLKQVYYLRNIETILLVLGASIASTFFLEGF